MSRVIVAGIELRGDVLRRVVLRSDAIPVPVTLEAEIRVDDSIRNGLAEGKTIQAGMAKDNFYIIKSVRIVERASQGNHGIEYLHIIALLEACYTVAFVRDKAIVKEKATLQQIYKAAGASLKTIDADFPVDRFMCYVGESPSFHIARALQENCGLLRWKANKMTFFKLPDLFKQKTVMALPDVSQDIISGFTERHEVQSFYSVNEKGEFIYGNRTKARAARFMPHMTEMQLKNLTRCLVLRKIIKLYYSEELCAGDLISIEGGNPLVIITAAHVFTSGTDGGTAEQYTKLWLSELTQ
jgi:hypothetical protein